MEAAGLAAGRDILVVEAERLAEEPAALEVATEMLAELAMREARELERFGDEAPAYWDGKELHLGASVVSVLRRQQRDLLND